MLLVHGFSGAYDKVSKEVAGFIRSLEGSHKHKPLFGEWTEQSIDAGFSSDITENLMELLLKRGYLTELTANEEHEQFKSIANAVHKAGLRPEYIFMPTYDCNLRCAYCFQDHMRTDESNRHLLKRMTTSTVDQIFDAIPRIEQHCGVSDSQSYPRDIGFFGGEPFLRSNYEIVRRIIEMAKALGEASFWAISNATELDTYEDLLGPELISRLQVTLDGPQDEHDIRRIYTDGSGSFNIIASNISMALERGVAVGIRINLDRNNLSRVPRLCQQIVSLGWSEHPNFAAYAAPIVASNENTESGSTFGSLELFRELTEMRKTHPVVGILSRPDDRLVIMAHQIFCSGERPAFQATFCGAQNGLFIFDAFGDVYACLERTGNRQLRIGQMSGRDEILINDPVYKLWRSRNVTSNDTCSKCRYSLYCGGGCAILAEVHNGGFNRNHCDGYQARFRTCVAEAYLDFRAGKLPATRVSRACRA